MDNARLALLFNRYVQRTCSPEERNEFLRLVAESESDLQLKNMMKDLWESAGNEQPVTAEASDNIFQSILKADDGTIALKHTGTSLWLKAAAAFLIFVLSLGALYYFLGSEKIEQQANDIRRVPVEHQIIKLADGSVVTLNSGSTLDYPETFDGKNVREVSLRGEGFFDIKHDPSKSFIVRTGSLTTTVLGTAFNIKAYAYEKNITVTVTRGKVKVSDEKNILGTITPNQQITFNTESQQSTRQNVDSRSFTSWTDHDVFFDDVTVSDALAHLEQRFNVTIRVGNEKLKDCRFTATFVRGEELDEILMVICEFNQASFTRVKENEILIEGKGCQ